MIGLSNKKQIEELKFQNTRLQIKNSKLEEEIQILKTENQRQKDLLSEWEKSYKKSIRDVANLKNELKKYNPNLKPRSKQITKNDIKRIKELFEMNEYNYREISQITKWSICTISKVINGFYD
jgi:DNA repair exonuclease SbcCD ATPase subunit